MPKLKVKGRAIVIASTEPSPGSAPTIKPKTTPPTMAKNTAGEARSSKAG